MWLDSGWTYDPNGGFKILMYIQNIHQILWAIFMIFNRDSSALGSDDSSSDAESDSEAGGIFCPKMCVLSRKWLTRWRICRTKFHWKLVCQDFSAIFLIEMPIFDPLSLQNSQPGLRLMVSPSPARRTQSQRGRESSRTAARSLTTLMTRRKLWNITGLWSQRLQRWVLILI